MLIGIGGTITPMGRRTQHGSGHRGGSRSTFKSACRGLSPGPFIPLRDGPDLPIIQSQVLKVFYELKYAGNLPSPAGVGMQILRLTQEPDCGLDEITKVIRSDPALTGRVLKVATSVAHGAGGHAPPLEEAVLRVGFGTLRSLVLGFSLVSSNPRLVCRAFDYNAFSFVTGLRGVRLAEFQ